MKGMEGPKEPEPAVPLEASSDASHIQNHPNDIAGKPKEASTQKATVRKGDAVLARSSRGFIIQG
jgi:hypothetical protein